MHASMHTFSPYYSHDGESRATDSPYDRPDAALRVGSFAELAADPA